MRINRKTKLILSLVSAFIISDIDIINCCSNPEPITTTKAPDTTTSKGNDTNTIDLDH